TRITAANNATITQYNQMKQAVLQRMQELENANDGNNGEGMYADMYFSQAVQDVHNANPNLFVFNGQDKATLIQNDYEAFNSNAYIQSQNNSYEYGTTTSLLLEVPDPSKYTTVGIGSGADYEEYYMNEGMYNSFTSTGFYNVAALFIESGRSIDDLNNWLNTLDLTNLTGNRLVDLAEQETGKNLTNDKVGYRYMTFDNNEWHDNGLYSINQKLGNQFNIAVPDIATASRNVWQKVRDNDATFLAQYPQLAALAQRIDTLQQQAAAGDYSAQAALSRIEANMFSNNGGAIGNN
ncbi:MAG: hypothetical protein KC476_05460, partial [Cyanobacteria bacterium HKST-UBA06]|nr:hypothetical protein [Cyanobacteria bacterium HKST-UBA06]